MPSRRPLRLHGRCHTGPAGPRSLVCGVGVVVTRALVTTEVVVLQQSRLAADAAPVQLPPTFSSAASGSATAATPSASGPWASRVTSGGAGGTRPATLRRAV